MTQMTGSWVVVDKQTGRAVFETFSAKVIDAINRERYEVLTAYDYLVRLNRDIKRSGYEK